MINEIDDVIYEIDDEINENREAFIHFIRSVGTSIFTMLLY